MQQLGVRGVLDLGACAMLSNDCCLFSAYLAVSNGIFFLLWKKLFTNNLLLPALLRVSGHSGLLMFSSIP